MPPARSQSDSKASLRVLAADEVVWTGGNIRGIGGGLEYRINHPSRKNPKRPDFQNILFADGHVEGRGSEYYVADPDASNGSASHDVARTRLSGTAAAPPAPAARRASRGEPAGRQTPAEVRRSGGNE